MELHTVQAFNLCCCRIWLECVPVLGVSRSRWSLAQSSRQFWYKSPQQGTIRNVVLDDFAVSRIQMRLMNMLVKLHNYVISTQRHVRMKAMQQHHLSWQQKHPLHPEATINSLVTMLDRCSLHSFLGKCPHTPHIHILGDNKGSENMLS